MTTTEAAQLLGVSNSTIHRWCAQRMIHATRDVSRPGARHGKPLVITVDALLLALSVWGHIHGVVGLKRCRQVIKILNKAARDAAKGK